MIYRLLNLIELVWNFLTRTELREALWCASSIVTFMIGALIGGGFGWALALVATPGALWAWKKSSGQPA